MTDWLWKTQTLSTFALFGLIWTIQLVHYPAFRFVDPSEFESFHSFHSNMITVIVLPLMVIELGSAILLLRQGGPNPILIANLLSILLIWGSTFLLSVPIHNQLGAGKDLELISKLVLTNWPRTILWSIRALGLFFGKWI